jgi:hypothetical protein
MFVGKARGDLSGAIETWDYIYNTSIPRLERLAKYKGSSLFGSLICHAEHKVL